MDEPILLLFLLLFVILCCGAPFWFKSFNRWRLARKYQAIEVLLGKLYQDINPFAISIQNRQLLNIQDPNFVYGEILVTTLLHLINALPLKKPFVFYDLGAGCGKLVIAVALAFPVRKAVGIEFLPDLNQVAQQKWAKFSKTHPQKTQEANVVFHAGDYFEQDFHEADCIVINATCIEKSKWDKLVKSFKNLKLDTKIIVVSKAISDPNFELIRDELALMSWGYATVRIYSKK